ncbi:response regulator [Allocoleopsis sp.]|uniref:response regulator transcription factor n=1 Tax=Allocoleopsis sp. TaxID=3088169 RepID=UPI002FCFF1E6
MNENSLKVLVIEDEKEIRENLEDLLSDKYHVFTASGGREGLDIAQRELPHLVICDVTMAGVTGHNVLTALRSNPITANIPFIFLTAKVSKDDMRLGMELGADDYLTKPFTRKELLSAISARLKRFEKV